MSLIQLYVPTEVAHDTVAELGELGDVQFKDVCVGCSHLKLRVERPFALVKSQHQPFSTLVCRRDSSYR